MIIKRTDLAMEAKEIWEESAQTQTALQGVKAEEKEINGFKITEVKILDDNGAKELCKPKGTYLTIELDYFINREDDAFSLGACAIAHQLEKMAKLGKSESVLVVGLGNDAITPDAVGPETIKNTMVTRHLVKKFPSHFSSFRSVTAMEAGVLGTTGIESAELIKAAAEKIKPDCIIAVDALASRRTERLCRTVQIADTGIVPGSGVGNGRDAINLETMGVRVIAVGVPTVVDAATLAADLAEKSGIAPLSEEKIRSVAGNMIVTPREIDSRVSDISKLIGYGINLALHDGLTIEDINMFMS